MTQDLIDLALGANRVLTYAGYVLLAGTLTFWSVMWPDGRRNVMGAELCIAFVILSTTSSWLRPHP